MRGVEDRGRKSTGQRTYVSRDSGIQTGSGARKAGTFREGEGLDSKEGSAGRGDAAARRAIGRPRVCEMRVRLHGHAARHRGEDGPRVDV